MCELQGCKLYSIPSCINIAGEVAFVYYTSQPVTCRKCGGQGHWAAKCRGIRCFNCEQPGHSAEACEQTPLCEVCLASSHVAACCSFLIFSSNLAEPKDTEPVKEAPVKETPVKETPPTDSHSASSAAESTPPSGKERRRRRKNASGVSRQRNHSRSCSDRDFSCERRPRTPPRVDTFPGKYVDHSRNKRYLSPVRDRKNCYLSPVRDSDTAFYDSDFDFPKDRGRNKKYSESS